MGVADVELVDQRARLVGVDDDHLAGGVGAGEDPHTAAHGVGFLQLLRLKERRRSINRRLGNVKDARLYLNYLLLLWRAVAAPLAWAVLLGVQGVAAARKCFIQ